jgi:hypothetical protein
LRWGSAGCSAECTGRSDRLVMARARHAETQRARPPPLWPVLCSAVLAGIVIASEIPRARRPANRTGPATGAFGVARSSDEPAAAQHKRAQEVGRGRHAQAPWQIPCRLERYLLAHLSADRRGPPAGRRCGRRVLWPSSGFSGRDRIGFFVWIVRKSLGYQRAIVTPCRNSPTGRRRYPLRTDRAADRRKARCAQSSACRRHSVTRGETC